jgi:hypothetical protein
LRIVDLTGNPHAAIHNHLMASGLIGDPTAPVIGNGGATNRNS